VNNNKSYNILKQKIKKHNQSYWLNLIIRLPSLDW
jgi:hypothetical protein